jgi:hypothetical protein
MWTRAHGDDPRRSALGDALNRQMAHYAFHVGQIVMLAKHLAQDHWQPLTVPRNRSEEFNRRVTAGEASQR